MMIDAFVLQSISGFKLTAAKLFVAGVGNVPYRL